MQSSKRLLYLGTYRKPCAGNSAFAVDALGEIGDRFGFVTGHCLRNYVAWQHSFIYFGQSSDPEVGVVLVHFLREKRVARRVLLPDARQNQNL
jgi:hypothetical protein